MLDLLPEETLREFVNLLVRLVEVAGAAVIFAGAAIAFVRFVVVALRRHDQGFIAVRLFLGRFLALGLEFQLASDVLRTAIAPSFTQIGQLAAIAAIRTALNFFLNREIEREGRAVESRGDRVRPDGEG
ncbi:DUF1622 domain-containing protein [Streptosporangium sp. NPDC023615]|uniref:DUF1622 domain-containing protein n=1 Tax=Streptosporangium sp. NPDC023615 TaxID=3154794 RepID=UPI003446E6EE